MSGKNFYDVLGVSREATTAEIRSAFVLRSKVMHPDRFDQAKQPQEWKLANELLQELNRANAILRDPVSRRQYDESIFGRAAGPPPVSPRQPPPPRPTAQKTRKTDTQKFDFPENEAPEPRAQNLWMPNVFRGELQYSEQPQSVQMRLKQRSDHRVGDQMRRAFQSNSVFKNIISLGFPIFCLYEVALPGTQAWTPSGYIGLLVWCVILGYVFGQGFNGLIKWFSSPLKSWVVVTPLYLMLMDYGEVFVWPLWEVKSIGSSGKAKFQVNIQVGEKGDRLSFGLPNAGAYTQFYNFVVERQKRLHLARVNRETRYFDEVNDLIAATPSKRDVQPSRSPVPPKLVNGLAILAAFLVYSFAASRAPATPPMAIFQANPAAPIPAASATPSASPPIPVENFPVQTPPPDGAVYNYTYGNPSVENQLQPQNIQDGQEPTYPFPVKSDDPGGYRIEERSIIGPLTINTPAGENYLIKLIEVQTNQPVMSFYVSASSSVTVKVPLGNYAIHCAFGTTWYGMDHLFGTSTGFSKLDDTFSFTQTEDSISTETVTLYPVTNGNLQTSPLDKKDF